MLFQKSSGVNITRHDYIFLLEIKEINDHVINSVAYEQAWRYQQRIRPVMHLMKCLRPETEWNAWEMIQDYC